MNWRALYSMCVLLCYFTKTQYMYLDSCSAIIAGLWKNAQVNVCICPTQFLTVLYTLLILTFLLNIIRLIINYPHNQLTLHPEPVDLSAVAIFLLF